ncbi:hypothetical protein [Streptomyces sp. ISL-11]|uniref:hypothetical protein n=1 Tax=Streptomyces sp. ISL-11 TaxID=2819174 RepID=UPI001BE74566|nr:hypothetical protein [Streptomyces sp. ISL-11]MBT2386382.1 hypothetical protein [Streptomyces sp. ISL-11]
MKLELTEARLLDMWETGSGQEPPARALLLAGAAADGTDTAGPVAGLTLAELNALLLDLRETCFGETFPCATDCPGCDEQLEVAVTTDELRAPRTRVPPGRRQRTDSLRADGCEVTYRALTGGDLLAVDPSAPDARRTLLSRCVVGAEPASDVLPDAVLEAVAERLGALDPGADTAVPLTCPYCRHSWSATFDLAGYVWAEIEGYARRLLHQVHMLARGYGWTESDALAVSPLRRQFYLEAVAG